MTDRRIVWTPRYETGWEDYYLAPRDDGAYDEQHDDRDDR